MRTAEDNVTIEAMHRYGGSFVQALAEAARLADDDNLDRIKKAWPEYWQRYSEMGKIRIR